LLAQATSDPKYLNASLESAIFVHNHLTNSEDLIMDGIFADSCSLGPNNQGAHLSVFNSGLIIEGLAILNSMLHNSSMQEW